VADSYKWEGKDQQGPDFVAPEPDYANMTDDDLARRRAAMSSFEKDLVNDILPQEVVDRYGGMSPGQYARRRGREAYDQTYHDEMAKAKKRDDLRDAERDVVKSGRPIDRHLRLRSVAI